jgi:vacuolar-type H+-ATPase subunit F/Vma7
VKIRVVGDRVLVDLFRMAGVPGRTPEGESDTAAAVDSFIAEPGVGVVLVGGTHAAALGAKFRAYVQRRKLPAVLPVPDRRDDRGCAAEIKEYLQRTLGIRL